MISAIITLILLQKKQLRLFRDMVEFYFFKAIINARKLLVFVNTAGTHTVRFHVAFDRLPNINKTILLVPNL